jgi:alpha-tubulin suppressor-like RCC1 family protein
MELNDRFAQYTKQLANLTAAGELISAADLDMLSSFDVAQTTAGIAATIAKPNNIIGKTRIWLSNSGSAPITVQGFTIAPGKEIELFHNGNAWDVTGSDSSGGTITNNWYNTVTAAAPAVTDAVTLSQNYPQNPNYGGMWLHNGMVYSWGVNVAGIPNTVGNANEGTINNPVPMPVDAYFYNGTTLVPHTPKFVKFWRNNWSAFYLDQEGKLWMKGANNSFGVGAGVVGDNIEAIQCINFFVINNIRIVDFAMGSGDNGALDYQASYFAITDTGAVYAWGYNSNGQLGLGNLTLTAVPTLVTLPAGAKPVAIQVSSNQGGAAVHAGILLDDGRLFVSGANASGQLGLGNTTQRTSFVLSRSGVANFWLSVDNSFAVLADGTIVTTGNNFQGCHGRGSTTATNTWLPVPALTGAKAIRITCGTHGNLSTMVLDDQGRIWVAGANTWGQMGLGSSNVTQQNTLVLLTAAQAPFQGKVKDGFFAGSAACTGFVLTTEGEVWSVGANQYANRALGNKGDAVLLRSTWNKCAFQGVRVITMRPAAEQNTATFLALDENNDLWTAGIANQIGGGNATGASIPSKVTWGRNTGTPGAVVTVNQTVANTRVAVGAVLDPNVASPFASPIEGDSYIQTSDGTPTGQKLSEWRYTGSAWIQTSQSSAAIIANSSGFRTYFPQSAVVSQFLTLPTAATVTAAGLTAVGGATVAPYSLLFAGRGLISMNAPVAGTTPAAIFTVPTSYVRQVVPIIPGVSNVYHYLALTDRIAHIDVWVCNATTGIPERRLAANVVTSGTPGLQSTLNLGPDNGESYENSNLQWLNYVIPREIITAYATASNTIRLALRPAASNGEAALFYMAGYAVTANPFDVAISDAANHFVDSNGAGVRSAALGDWNGGWLAQLAANATLATVRLPLSTTTKDLYLGIIQNANNEGGFGLTEWTIRHPSGNVVLGRPRVHIKPPYGNEKFNYFFVQRGFVIPAAVLAAKAVTPVNSAVSYLEIQITNRSVVEPAFWAGAYTEAVN